MGYYWIIQFFFYRLANCYQRVLWQQRNVLTVCWLKIRIGKRGKKNIAHLFIGTRTAGKRPGDMLEKSISTDEFTGSLGSMTDIGCEIN